MSVEVAVDSSVEVSAELTFRDLQISPEILAAIESSGYTIPTPIQAGTIPLLLEGRDVLGQAQTGTGKTAAFAVPMLQRIDVAHKHPQVLVLTPTRELAIQVAEAFERYASGLKGVRVAAIYGGQDYGAQFRQLDRGTHVVVGTPGRVMDHIRRGSLKLEGLRGMVLDEADEMLRMGFAEDVEWILTQTPAERQIALFSATMPEMIRRIAQQHLRNPAEVTIRQKTATADTIEQRYVVVAPHQKQEALARVLEVEPIDGVIVFVKMKSTTEPLAAYLASQGHRTAALSSEIAQKQRERIIDNLRNGKIDIIIATDVAARGLDVQRISHVINYDLPFDSEGYVHRIGRTGRAGRTGQAIMFLHPRERNTLKRLEKATRQTIAPMEIPSKRMINQSRVAKFHGQITAALENPKVDTFASLIEQYRTANPETPIERIAAALAMMAVGNTQLFVTEDVKSAGFIEPRDTRGDFRGGRGDFRNDARGSRSGGRSLEEDRRGARPLGNNTRPAGNGAGEVMETFRIEVGRVNQVKPANIVGAIANETGLSSAYIGRIDIYDEYSTVDLLAGMPPEIFFALKQVWVAGRRLNITRVSEGSPAKVSRSAEGDAPKRPAGRTSFNKDKGADRGDKVAAKPKKPKRVPAKA